MCVIESCSCELAANLRSLKGDGGTLAWIGVDWEVVGWLIEPDRLLIVVSLSDLKIKIYKNATTHH